MNALPDKKLSRITKILYGSGEIGFRISGISNALRLSPNGVRAIHVLMGIILSL